MTKSNIDVLDVELASDEIARSIDLLDLQHEELDDFYSSTLRTTNAKNDVELEEAKTLLMIQCQQRYKFLESLNSSANDILSRLQNKLDRLTDDELKSRKESDEH